MPSDPALSALAKNIGSGQPWPRPACPTCQTGYIKFSSPTEDEGHDSASARNHPAFEPEWIAGTFVVRGQCENPDCQQAVHGTGNYRVDYSEKSNWDDESEYPELYSSYFTVTHLHPPMLIMPIPKSAPDEVREGVLRASRVLFADPGLASGLSDRIELVGIVWLREHSTDSSTALTAEIRAELDNLATRVA